MPDNRLSDCTYGAPSPFKATNTHLLSLTLLELIQLCLEQAKCSVHPPCTVFHPRKVRTCSTRATVVYLLSLITPDNRLYTVDGRSTCFSIREGYLVLNYNKALYTRSMWACFQACMGGAFVTVQAEHSGQVQAVGRGKGEEGPFCHCTSKTFHVTLFF